MYRIFLIGYMGAGKTTVGAELSRQMGLSFIDLDLFIERRYHKTIREIFVQKGEDAFRMIEKNVLREVGEFENIVISTGGGAPCFYENMDFMNASGVTVYLKASPDELVKRIEGCRHTRPVLKERSGDELKSFVENSLNERSRFYEQAAVIFQTEVIDTPEQIANIASQLKTCIEEITS